MQNTEQKYNEHITKEQIERVRKLKIENDFNEYLIKYLKDTIDSDMDASTKAVTVKLLLSAGDLL